MVITVVFLAAFLIEMTLGQRCRCLEKCLHSKTFDLVDANKPGLKSNGTEVVRVWNMLKNSCSLKELLYLATKAWCLKHFPDTNFICLLHMLKYYVVFLANMTNTINTVKDIFNYWKVQNMQDTKVAFKFDLCFQRCGGSCCFADANGFCIYSQW